MADRVADHAVNARLAADLVRAIHIECLVERGLSWGGRMLDRRVGKGAAAAR